MALPSLPPAVDYEIVFDGGARGNPGPAYGSYRLRGRDLPERIERLDFGPWGTNNEAEYRALIHGLEDLLTLLAREGRSPESVSLLVLGDSQLVVNQLTAGWKVRAANLAPLHRRARELLARFGRVDLRWHPRTNSVLALGH